MRLVLWASANAAFAGLYGVAARVCLAWPQDERQAAAADVAALVAACFPVAVSFVALGLRDARLLFLSAAPPALFFASTLLCSSVP